MLDLLRLDFPETSQLNYLNVHVQYFAKEPAKN